MVNGRESLEGSASLRGEVPNQFVRALRVYIYCILEKGKVWMTRFRCSAEMLRRVVGICVAVTFRRIVRDQGREGVV